MVGKFLSDSACSHLLFIDADIQFSADAVQRLLQADKDVCFGVYPSKNVHFENISSARGCPADVSRLKSLCLNYMLSFEYDNQERIIFDHQKKLIKVQYATSGFMLIKRSVIETMVAAYPHLQYFNEKTCRVHNIQPDKLYLLFDCIKHPETNDYLSEDFSFSYLWRKLGGEIWADMQSKLAHWGDFQFQGDLEFYLRSTGMIPDSVVTDLDR